MRKTGTGVLVPVSFNPNDITGTSDWTVNFNQIQTNDWKFVSASNDFVAQIGTNAIAQSSGKWYYEIRAVSSPTDSFPRIRSGFSNANVIDNTGTFTTTDFLYVDLDLGSAEVNPNQYTVEYKTGLTSLYWVDLRPDEFNNNNTLGIMLDLDNNTITVKHNVGGSTKTLATINFTKSGAYHPAFDFYNNHEYIANFGASSYVLGLPTGYSNWIGQ